MRDGDQLDGGTKIRSMRLCWSIGMVLWALEAMLDWMHLMEDSQHWEYKISTNKYTLHRPLDFKVGVTVSVLFETRCSGIGKEA